MHLYVKPVLPKRVEFDGMGSRWLSLISSISQQKMGLDQQFLLHIIKTMSKW